MAPVAALQLLWGSVLGLCGVPSCRLCSAPLLPGCRNAKSLAWGGTGGSCCPCQKLVTSLHQRLVLLPPGKGKEKEQERKEFIVRDDFPNSFNGCASLGEE